MLRAIGRALRWIWSGLDGLRKVLHLLLLVLIFAAIGSLFSRPIPLVPDKAALVVAPRGPIVEQFTGDPLERAVADSLRRTPSETRLRDVVEAIESAKTDPRISALYLDLGGMDGGGIVKLHEIADAVDAFRAAGKPVIAYGDAYDQRQYYLAAHADEVYLDPYGVVYVKGIAAYEYFVKDALDKLSVDWHVFRVGQYKSAVEMFTRNDMSPAAREETLSWTGSLWGTYKDDVAKARSIKPEVVQAYGDEAVAAIKHADGDLAKMALEAGLVSGLEGRYQVEERIARLTGEEAHSYKGIDLLAYLSNVHSTRALSSKPHDQVRVIVASGEIVPGEAEPGTVGSDTLVAQLRAARFDEAVKAVVLRIDSPGGSVFASEVIRREVAELKRAGKPVVASMSSLAASGGYYIAMDADRIVASPATITGSIGIFAMFPTVDRALARLGVHVDGVGTTAMAGELRPDRPLGEPAREILQQSLEQQYRLFVEHVAGSRKRTPEQIEAVAQGRVWSGAEAKRVGLVDELGGSELAIKRAAALAKLGKNYDVEYDESQPGIVQSLGFKMRVALARAVAPLLPRDLVAPLPRVLGPVVAELRRFDRLTDPAHVFAYCIACTAE